MKPSKAKYLLDVNVLVALIDEAHTHHKSVVAWFDATGKRDWGVCAFTEAGFLRVMTRSRTGDYSVAAMTHLLEKLALHRGYRYWPITAGWSLLAAPFRGRLFGHQQITDAFLLGLAVKESGVLVTLDQAMSHLAGAQYRRNLLVLE